MINLWWWFESVRCVVDMVLRCDCWLIQILNHVILQWAHLRFARTWMCCPRQHSATHTYTATKDKHMRPTTRHTITSYTIHTCFYMKTKRNGHNHLSLHLALSPYICNIFIVYIYIYKYTYILYILYILPNLFRTWYTPHYWIITPIMVLIESGAREIVRTIEMQHQKNPG